MDNQSKQRIGSGHEPLLYTDTLEALVGAVMRSDDERAEAIASDLQNMKERNYERNGENRQSAD